jgi:hypothetical protein
MGSMTHRANIPNYFEHVQRVLRMELLPAVHHYLPKLGIIYSHNFCHIIKSYELLLKISIFLVTSDFGNILLCFLDSGTRHF